jgi:hypothetical protein
MHTHPIHPRCSSSCCSSALHPQHPVIPIISPWPLLFPSLLSPSLHYPCPCRHPSHHCSCRPCLVLAVPTPVICPHHYCSSPFVSPPPGCRALPVVIGVCVPPRPPVARVVLFSLFLSSIHHHPPSPHEKLPAVVVSA